MAERVFLRTTTVDRETSSSCAFFKAVGDSRFAEMAPGAIVDARLT